MPWAITAEGAGFAKLGTHSQVTTPAIEQTMPNDLHYFMFFVGRLFQGAEMMIRHSEYIEADESNLCMILSPPGKPPGKRSKM